MASSSTTDPLSSTAEASPNAPPATGLSEETSPFSLLNALVQDMPDHGIVYQPPPLSQQPRERAGKTPSANPRRPARKATSQLSSRGYSEEDAGLAKPWPSSAPPKVKRIHLDPGNDGTDQPPARAERSSPSPRFPQRGPSRKVKRGFRSRPTPSAVDAVDKAVRIFESLSSRDHDSATTSPKASPEALPRKDHSIPDSPAAAPSPTPDSPAGGSSPGADLRIPPHPETETEPKADTATRSLGSSSAFSSNRVVAYRRRRRRRVPINPWTAENSHPAGASPANRQQQIDASLEALAKILETSLGERTSATPPVKEEAQTAGQSVPAGGHESPTVSAPPSTAEQPPAEPVSLRKSFAPQPAAQAKETKVKLVPRALAEEGKKKPPTPKAAFEITAPTTLVGHEAPISPFTKVAQGKVASHPRPVPGAGPAPPQAPVPSQASTAEPEPIIQSPFTPVAKKREPASEQAAPTPHPALDKTKPTTPFASPFATALAKKGTPKSQQNLSPPSPAKAEKPPVPEVKRTSGVSVEDRVPKTGAGAAELPLPTRSFGSVALPTGKERRTPLPAKSLPGAQVKPPLPPPRSIPAPAARGPSPATIPSAPQPPAVEFAPAEKPETTRAVRRNPDPRPAPRSWGFLTWLFGLISVLFLVIWVFEIYRTLTRSAPHFPDDIGLETPSEEQAASSQPQPPPAPAVDLSTPLECLPNFLAAESTEIRRLYVVEHQDDNLPTVMSAHYSVFPLGREARRQIVDDGIFPDTDRDYITVLVDWEEGGSTRLRLIADAEDNFRFSWYAFEQARMNMLRRYQETAWSSWTHFFIELKPLDPNTLPDGIIFENLYYRVTVPEDPEFEAIAYVDEDSSLMPEFQERFATERVYEVIAELQRNAPLLDDDRPVFRITRLVKPSWDPGP